MSDERLPFWPAALNKKMAAAYCGLSPETFEKVCPVKPIRFTQSVRGERYLRQRLDEWLLSIDPNEEQRPVKRKFGDRLSSNGEQERRPSMAERLYGRKE